MPGDRARTVANDGVRLHVREWPVGGDDVLLIHGLASSSHIWDLVAPRLVRLGLHPVAYDQRGHGRSSKPSSRYGFDRTTDDAAAVIRTTRLHRPIVVGHSWGANVALELALRRSRLVGGTVLLDGGFVTMRERFDWTTAKRTLSPPEFGGITLNTFLRRVHRNLVRTITVTPELDEVFRSLVRVDGQGRIRPRLSRANHLKILRSSWEQDTFGLLQRVRVPALILAARSRSGGSTVSQFERIRRSPRVGSGRSDPRCRSSGSRGSTTFRCSVPRRSPGGSRSSPRPSPAFGADARRMVGWRCSC